MAWFFDWTSSDEPGVVYDTSAEEGWDALRERYTPRDANAPFERLLEVAKESGVVSVLAEYRYIDLDYRNEHSRFYSTTYRRYPSVAHRLHFFSSDLPDDLTDLSGVQESYCGYSVMRPLEGTPVGRTMIKPPPYLRDATVCLARDNVNLFGTELQIEAMPFTSQDAQYMRCAHSAQWMVLYHAHLHHGLPRRLPGDIHDASLGGVLQGRQIPSEGLTVQQILSGLNELEISPGLLALPQSRQDSVDAGRHLSLYAILCRYVNSQMPPIVVSDSHAWVVVGYRVKDDRLHHDNIVLYRHDDARGPYIPVDDPWDEPEEEHHAWRLTITPLPRKVYMPGEKAEWFGSQWLIGTSGIARQLAEVLSDGNITYRTYARRSNRYKIGLMDRGVPEPVQGLYRLSAWPRYVWVVEAIDRQLHEEGQPSVLGEAIIDATANHLAGLRDPALLALHIPGRAVVVTPDHEESRSVAVPDPQPYLSGCRHAGV